MQAVTSPKSNNMANLTTIEPFKVMMHNRNEYGLPLQYPTDNVLIHDFHHSHVINMAWFLSELHKMVTDNRTLIVLFGLYQDLQETANWVDPLNKFYHTVPNPMVVFNGRLTTAATDQDTVAKLCVPYHKLLMFDRVSTVNWYQSLANREMLHFSNHAPAQRTHKAYWSSSKDYFPRRYLLAQLIKHHVLPDCLVNYKCTQTEFVSWPETEAYGAGFPDRFRSWPDWPKYQHINQECEQIAHLLPLPALDDTVEFSQTDPALFWSSYVGLVTDTNYDSDDVFLSEKIFNVMHHHQIFWYLGPPGALQYLQSQGYQTFGDIIDESYDQIQNHADRLVAATDSIIQFLRQPLDVLAQAYQKVLPKITHNKFWVTRQRPDVQYTQYCQQALDKK